MNRLQDQIVGAMVLFGVFVAFAIIFAGKPADDTAPPEAPSIGMPISPIAPTNQIVFLMGSDSAVAWISDLTTNGFTLRTSCKPCEARVTNGQWTIHFKR